MARSLSSTMIAAGNASETGEIPLFILVIEHTDITTLRFVANTEDVTSDGNVYTAYPFQINIPLVDSDTQIPTAQLRIDNIDQAIVAAIRGLSTAPTITASIILASTPDTVECGPYAFTLKNVTYNAIEITGTLGFEEILNEPFPGDTFNPQNFPGLF